MLTTDFESAASIFRHKHHYCIVLLQISFVLLLYFSKIFVSMLVDMNMESTVKQPVAKRAYEGDNGANVTKNLEQLLKV